jgi:MFS family permease
VWVRDVVRVVLIVSRNAGLSRLVIAYGLFIMLEYSVWIGMLVFAFGRGGAREAALVAVAQLLPAAVLAPFLATVADRRPPVWLLVGGYGTQAVAMAATGAVLYANRSPLLAYALAVVASMAVVTIRPAQAPLVPGLCNSTRELTSANVALGWFENVGIVAAGGLTGLLLAAANVGLVFVLSAGLAMTCAVLVLSLTTTPLAVESGHGQPVQEVVRAVRLLGRSRRPRLLVGLLTAEWVVLGALDVLFVVLAIDVLHRSQAWAGYLNMSFGIGGVLAGAVSAALVGRRLGMPIIAAGLVVSAALGLAAVSHEPVAMLAIVVVMGGGRAVFDVATRSLLQRAVPAEVIGRVFGVVEGLSMAALAVGSLTVPLFVGLGGSTLALVGVAAILPLAAVVGGRALVTLDADAHVPVVEIALLRSIRLFADLPAPALEGLAGSLQRVVLPAGSVLIREGEIGARYYAIADGELTIQRGGRDLGVRRRGDGVGEIALLRSMPRTATVTAATPATVYALNRDPFLAAVTGHRQTSTTADMVTEERLGDADPRRDDR